MTNIDLKEYLPLCYKEIIEEEAEQDALSIEINKLNATYEQAINDQFVQTASIDAITYYEDTFNIVANPSNPEETLQFRRERVLNRMKNLRPPYTYWYLRTVLDRFFGVDNYDLQIDEDKYIIVLESSAENGAWYHEIAVTVRAVIPCNLVYINKPRVDHGLFINETVISNLDVQHCYTLDGTWSLGMRPFVIESGEQISKMPEVSSITQNLIDKNLNFCKESVTKIKINDSIEITQIEKSIENSELTVSYEIHKSDTVRVTNIKLLDVNDTVLTNSNVYIPIDGDVVIKHKLKLEEDTNDK